MNILHTPITPKNLGRLLNKNTKYAHVLLRRLNKTFESLTLQNVAEITMKYRYVWSNANNKKRVLQKGCCKNFMWSLIDNVFKDTYKKCFDLYDNKCAICDTSEHLLIHHIDINHYNMSIHNLLPLCKQCHLIIHFFAHTLEWKRFKKHCFMIEWTEFYLERFLKYRERKERMAVRRGLLDPRDIKSISSYVEGRKSS